MSAFVPVTALSAQRCSSFNGSSSLNSCISSRNPFTRVLTKTTASRSSTIKSLMSEPNSSNTGGSIDFSKVNIEDIGSNLAGLVFTPESDNVESAIKTRVDVGYTQKQESAINSHINVEYTAMYAYHALWAYFDRDTVALPGFAKYFYEQSVEEREHAHEFMKYQNQRGGLVELKPIALPEMKFKMNDGTSDALYAMDLHLQLEKFVYRKLMDVHKVADEGNDPQMMDFIEGYLEHQLEAIKHAAEFVSQIKRVSTPHGIYHIDLTLRGEEAKAVA